MIRLLILGNGQQVKLIINSLSKNDFTIIDVEQDNQRSGVVQKDFENFLKSHTIMLNQLHTLKESDYDLVLSINYNKIISIQKFSGMKIINIHIGLLPKYRGNNANAWAVINGEGHIGYTLHEVTDILDGGRIYYKYEYDISNDDTYINGKNAIDLDINRNINSLLIKIKNDEIIPTSQEGSGYIYCVKLRPSDGIISDWNVCSNLLIRKSYVFGRPLGTGLSFQYHNAFYEIDKISHIKDFEPSIGIPGSVVYIRDNNLWIKTNDTAVELSGIRQNEHLVDTKQLFKIGMRLMDFKI